MSRTRVLTGLVLASIALLALSFLPTIAIVGITAVVGFLGALEWGDLRSQAPSTAFRRAYAVLVAIGVVILWRLFEHSVVAVMCHNLVFVLVGNPCVWCNEGPTIPLPRGASRGLLWGLGNSSPLGPFESPRGASGRLEAFRAASIGLQGRGLEGP